MLDERRTVHHGEKGSNTTSSTCGTGTTTTVRSIELRSTRDAKAPTLALTAELLLLAIKVTGHTARLLLSAVVPLLLSTVVSLVLLLVVIVSTAD